MCLAIILCVRQIWDLHSLKRIYQTMRRVDCPNVKCRCASSLWFSYVIALLFSNGFLPPGTTCLAHCKLQCFCVGLSSACTRRRSNLTGTAVALLPGYSHSPRPGCPKRQNWLLLYSSYPSNPPAGCFRLPNSQESLSCLAFGTSKAVLETNHGSRGRHLTKNIGQERPVQNFSKLRS